MKKIYLISSKIIIFILLLISCCWIYTDLSNYFKLKNNKEQYLENTTTTTTVAIQEQTSEKDNALEELEKTPILLQGFINFDTEIKEQPDSNSKSLYSILFNTEITYIEFDNTETTDKWVQVFYGDISGYIQKKYISQEKNIYKEYTVPKNKGFKSYMRYTAITSKTSYQYKLQYEGYAYTGEYGIRQVNGRYCMAIGSYFNVVIGQYFDIVLENGTIIEAIKGDAKADIHTDKQNIFGLENGCCSEFIIDGDVVDERILVLGNMSYCKPEWQSPVKAIRVYNIKIFDN